MAQNCPYHSEERDRLQYHAQVIYPKVIPWVREIARKLGYGVAVHGSLLRDLDLVASPWTKWAVDSEQLAYVVWASLPHHFSEFPQFEEKPHGRKAWHLHFGSDAPGLLSIDLSIMPRIP